MKRIVFCGALLLAASSANADTLLGTGYRVTQPPGMPGIEIVGNTVIVPGLPVANSEISNTASVSENPGLTFEALSGFRIDGYDVTYELNFASSTYLVTGIEEGADFGGVLPGNLFVGSGRFDTTTGPSISFLATDPDTAVEVTHRVDGAALNLSYSLFVRGLADFCTDPAVCNSSTGGIRSLISALGLGPIAVAPNVTAVPEPAAYALTLAGLLAVAAASRRHRKSSGTSA